MSEAYPVGGPLRCYRMLHMALDMPFGYLLATLDTKANALLAAEDNSDRALPELVYTMFVPFPRITDVYEARAVELRVKFKSKDGGAGAGGLELPSAGFQNVEPIAGTPPSST